MELLVAACWLVLVLVWIGTAVAYGRDAPPAARRVAWWPLWLTAAAVYALVRWLVPPSVWAPVTVHAPWLTVVGAVLLGVSTAFALWARFALGRMWNSVPTIRDGHELRTDGPYALVRHPIYTGLLGMVLGTAAIAGFGMDIVILVVVGVVMVAKLRLEERMLTEQFPDAYPAYRAAVPALIPGLRLGSRRPTPL